MYEADTYVQLSLRDATYNLTGSATPFREMGPISR